MAEQANRHLTDEPVPHEARTKALTVFGRQGSPTVTVALPFSRVDVRADSAAPLVAELAALTGRLARALESAGLAESSIVEFAAIANAADALVSAGHSPQRMP